MFKSVFFIVCSLLLLSGCSERAASNKAFNVVIPENASSNINAKAVSEGINRFAAVCPGLHTYAADFSGGIVSEAILSGYEGGFVVQFKIKEKPTTLPAPLNVRSSLSQCFIVIDKDISKAFVAKRACHSICDGKWHDNDQNSTGREFVISRASR